MKRRTVFSSCRSYRYVLWREFDAANPAYALFIGLNPSTADETRDDPTIRRCKEFARRWGCGAVCVANLFAFRATRPADLKSAPSPIGRANDRWLVRLAAEAEVVVAAWGIHGSYGSFAGRDRAVLQLLDIPLSASRPHETRPAAASAVRQGDRRAGGVDSDPSYGVIVLLLTTTLHIGSAFASRVAAASVTFGPSSRSSRRCATR